MISLGFFGGGYVLYKLYESQKIRNLELEKQLEGEREAEELIKTQLQTHYENIQRISDTTTLPYAMHYMRMRILDDLDLSHVTEKLMQGKGQGGGGLTSKEKLELWERLKILSFTRVAASMWSMTMLCLYVRIQVNILGRHLYLQVARRLEGSGVLVKDEEDSFSRHGQQDFLATADYLSTYGIDTLITNMHNVAMEVLKETQLKDPFSMSQLREAIVQILDLFMKINAPDYWIRYLVPESATAYRQLMATSSKGFDDSSVFMDVRKLEQLMSETRAVLSSPDFTKIVDVSLKKVVDVLVEDVDKQLDGVGPSSVPLAKLLPRITQAGLSLLEEPSSNKYIKIVRSLPEVRLFYTLLYANIQPSSQVA